MAPPAAPAGHRPIQSFFRAGYDHVSTAGQSAAPPEAPAAPAPASVPTVSAPVWDRPNDRPVVAYARRRRGLDRGTRNGDARGPETNATRLVGRTRVSSDEPTTKDDRPSPSTSGCHGGERPAKRPPSRTKRKQLFLDLGQKSFGHVACTTCGLLYAKGEREDERTHATYHAAHVAVNGASEFALKDSANRFREDEKRFKKNPSGGLPCPKRWGYESAKWRETNGEGSCESWIVEITRNEHPKKRAVCARVLSHVETSLGLEPGWCGSSEQAKTFLYVSGDKIQAALVAEPVRVGYRTVVTKTYARENEMDSDGKTHRPCTDKARTAVGSWTVLRKGDVSVRATLGVRAVWTHPDCRRRGIGKRLFETARHALISGYVCALSECAFTQPTESGTSFARSVCGEEDGTFLVYE